MFPMFTMFWYVFTIINMGCPPSLNYFSEVFIFTTVKGMSSVYILPMALICQFRCVYGVFLYGYVNHGGVSSLIRRKRSLRDRYLRRFLFSRIVLFLGFFVMDFFF